MAKKKDSVNRDAMTKQEDKEKAAAPAVATFTFNGKEYRFKIPRYINTLGNLMTAEQALEQPAELERLVAIRSGVIEEVTKKK